MDKSAAVPVRRALLSVSDKTGIVEFARGLAELGVEILSTGGTATTLRDNGLTITDVSAHTGFPEIMSGRVKTLHPKIHGGILARRGIDDDVMQMHDIAPIDMVVVNLYPFKDVTTKAGCTRADAIENIDIGGPTMIRAAAKNHAYVTVVVDHSDYENVLDALSQHQGQSPDLLRRCLAQKAFAHTAQYDAAINAYLLADLVDSDATEVPDLQLHFIHQQALRYGENPHQNAAFYREINAPEGTIASATQLQGKALSYNNIADSDAALSCVKEFTEQPACVIVKHANPCGVALASHQVDAYQRAFATDPTSSFGGIIAFNTSCDEATARCIIEKQFVEVVIAPSFSAEALSVFSQKPNVRILATGQWPAKLTPWQDYKRVSGGLLVQDGDIHQITSKELSIVSKRQPSPKEMQDLLFAWQVAKHVKSNAIVYAKDQATIGVGAGQMSRVVSARIAGMKADDAKLDVPGSVMASDAFFPFRDGIDAAAEAGIKAIIQPGGSIRDEEIIAAADEANMAMVFTGIRHFKH